MVKTSAVTTRLVGLSLALALAVSAPASTQRNDMASA